MPTSVPDRRRRPSGSSASVAFAAASSLQSSYNRAKVGYDWCTALAGFSATTCRRAASHALESVFCAPSLYRTDLGSRPHRKVSSRTATRDGSSASAYVSNTSTRLERLSWRTETPCSSWMRDTARWTADPTASFTIASVTRLVPPLAPAPWARPSVRARTPSCTEASSAGSFFSRTKLRSASALHTTTMCAIAPASPLLRDGCSQ
eukprot:scaffold4357_cov113-Isochrysis_galbana.AAC.24